MKVGITMWIMLYESKSIKSGMGSEFVPEGGEGESTGEFMVANGATLLDKSSIAINESSHPENS